MAAASGLHFIRVYSQAHFQGVESRMPEHVQAQIRLAVQLAKDTAELAARCVANTPAPPSAVESQLSSFALQRVGLSHELAVARINAEGNPRRGLSAAR